MKIGHFSGKFLPWTLGHYLNAIAASQYVDVLYVVLTYNKKEMLFSVNKMAVKKCRLICDYLGLVTA
jgi:phosphopantetheine adenylyltransferase